MAAWNFLRFINQFQLSKPRSIIFNSFGITKKNEKNSEYFSIGLKQLNAEKNDNRAIKP